MGNCSKPGLFRSSRTPELLPSPPATPTRAKPTATSVPFYLNERAGRGRGSLLPQPPLFLLRQRKSTPSGPVRGMYPRLELFAQQRAVKKRIIVLVCAGQEVRHLLLTSSCSLPCGAGRIPRCMLAEGDGKRDRLSSLN
jgi:hypothetical protein